MLRVAGVSNDLNWHWDEKHLKEKGCDTGKKKKKKEINFT